MDPSLLNNQCKQLDLFIQSHCKQDEYPQRDSLAMLSPAQPTSNSYNAYSMNRDSAALPQKANSLQPPDQQQVTSAPPKESSLQSKLYSNSGLILIAVGGVLLSLVVGIADSWKSFKKG